MELSASNLSIMDEDGAINVPKSIREKLKLQAGDGFLFGYQYDDLAIMTIVKIVINEETEYE